MMLKVMEFMSRFTSDQLTTNSLLDLICAKFEFQGEQADKFRKAWADKSTIEIMAGLRESAAWTQDDVSLKLAFVSRQRAQQMEVSGKRNDIIRLCKCPQTTTRKIGERRLAFEG